MGSIYRRKGTKKYTIKYYKNGKEFVEATHSDKIEVAKRILKLREGEISQGKLPGMVYDRIKFDELMEDLLLDYRLNQKRTVTKAERCVRYLMEEFKGMKVVDVTTSRIKKLIEKRKEQGFSNASINRELAALKRAFNLAIRCTPPKVALVPYIPMLKENNIRKGFVEYEEFVALREVLPHYLKPVVTFAYFTGWRRGEVLGLLWKQVNLKDGIVRLEPGETKNDEGRTLYMEPELWEMMKNLHKNRRLGCQHVFQLDGNVLSSFRKSWRKACITINRPGLLFHDLRRSGVRNMIRAGIPERVCMAISGHKTRSVFDRYNIVSQEDLIDAARKRQAFTDSQAGQVQFRYNRPFEGEKVIDMTSATG
jgi:integrase